MNKKITPEIFLQRSRTVHGGSYDYSRTEYKGRDIPVIIRCKACGDVFEQKPRLHMRGSGCSICSMARGASLRKSNTSEFKRKAVLRHGPDRYDYSLASYVDAKTKIQVRCRRHNHIFKVTPNSHLSAGAGCRKCAGEAIGQALRATDEKFQQKAIAKHGEGKFDYSLAKYTRAHEPVTIICRKCNTQFEQVAAAHTNAGSGCSNCARLAQAERQRYTTEQFIEIATARHGSGKFDYSLVDYQGDRVPVVIICLSCDNEFEQLPDSHINQAAKCPYCRQSRGEAAMARLLKERELPFSIQKRFPKQLGRLSFDFEIPEQRMLIEIDGLQHFKSIHFNPNQEDFEAGQARDLQKTLFAIDNGYTLIRIDYVRPSTALFSDYLDRALDIEASLIVSSSYAYRELISSVRKARPHAIIATLDDNVPMSHPDWSPEAVEIIRSEWPTFDLTRSQEELDRDELWALVELTGNSGQCTPASSITWMRTILTEATSDIGTALRIASTGLHEYILEAC